MKSSNLILYIRNYISKIIYDNESPWCKWLKKNYGCWQVHWLSRHLYDLGLVKFLVGSTTCMSTVWWRRQCLQGAQLGWFMSALDGFSVSIRKARLVHMATGWISKREWEYSRPLKISAWNSDNLTCVTFCGLTWILGQPQIQEVKK